MDRGSMNGFATEMVVALAAMGRQQWHWEQSAPPLLEARDETKRQDLPHLW